MHDRGGRGKIILINGASSSGKSTLALALQRNLDEPFWHYSIDHLREAGVLPMERVHSGELDWPSLRPAFFDGFQRSLPAFAEAGNNLIVEHIVESAEWMERLVELLSSIDVFFVGVHCPLPELERREEMRGDRRTGEARADFDAVHRFAEYDLEIDSTESVEHNVRQLISSWRSRESPRAFERMANLLSKSRRHS